MTLVLSVHSFGLFLIFYLGCSVSITFFFNLFSHSCCAVIFPVRTRVTGVLFNVKGLCAGTQYIDTIYSSAIINLAQGKGLNIRVGLGKSRGHGSNPIDRADGQLEFLPLRIFFR